MIRKIYKENIYEYMLNLLCSISVILLLCYQFEITISARNVILTGAVLTTAVIAMLKNYTRISTYVIAALIILMSVLIVNRYMDMADYITWLTDVWNNSYREDTTYEIVTVAVGMFIVLIPMYFLIKLRLARYGVAVAYIGYIVYGTISEINITKYAIIPMVIYIIIIATECMCYRISHDWKTSEQMTADLAPFMLFVFIIFSILTYPDHRYEWTMVKKAAGTIRQIGVELYALINPDEGESEPIDYNISLIGYSEGGGVEGSIKYNDINAMTLQSDKQQYKSIYLKGNVSNYFDGEKWSSTNDKRKSYVEYELDTVELLYAIHRADELENLKDYVLEETVLLTYTDLPTNAIFLPEKTLTLDVDEKYKYTLSYNQPAFSTTAGSGRFYEVSYLRVNQKKIDEIIRKSEGYKYSKSDSAIYSPYKYMLGIEHSDLKLDSVNLEEVFCQRAERIRKEYMNTDCVTEKVRILAEEIARNYTTDFDKLKALEAYLRTYTYTTSPAPTPEGEDFLEYFLFESKEGFCTYFATAFTMMSRSIGIPSRYVQGFVVDSHGTASGEDSKYAYTFNIPSNNAHAWSECYIEGVGFIAFEPTSGYDIYKDINWDVSDKQEIPEVEIEEIIHERQERQEKDYAKYGSMVLLIALGLILLIILGAVFYIVMRVVMYNRRYRKADTDKKLEMEESMIYILAKQIGCGIMADETFLEYMERLKGIYPEYKYSYIEYVDIFNRVHYDNAAVTEEELAKFTELRSFLTREVKENNGRFKYILSTYCKM